MKTVDIIHKYQPRPQIYLFPRDEDAEEAYRKVKQALEDHKPYSNSKSALVTFSSEAGETTIKVEDITMVGLADSEKMEPAQIEWSKYVGRIARASKIAEEGLED